MVFIYKNMYNKYCKCILNLLQHISVLMHHLQGILIINQLIEQVVVL